MSSPLNQDFGDYRLLRLLGAGGMAEVFLAERRGRLGRRRRVALKRLLSHFASDARFIDTLRDEARIASAIDHPHVASVYEFGEVDGTHFISMELIEGVDLAGVLRTLKQREARLPLEVGLYICAAVAEGLHAAHTLQDEAGQPLNVIHRDVSPHNILLSYNGDVKLIDFGVAKAESNLTKTKSGIIKGKLRYMSPEQAQAKPLDARADIFSLGMVLYKVVTGRLPFTGQNEFQIYDQILRKKPAPPRDLVPGLPDLINAITLKALRKGVERRFESAGEMAHVLRIALARLHPGFGARELARYLRAHAPREQILEEREDGDDFTSEVELELDLELEQSGPSSSHSIEARLAEAIAAAGPRATYEVEPLNEGFGLMDMGEGLATEVMEPLDELSFEFGFSSPPPIPPPTRRSPTLLIGALAALLISSGAGIFWLTRGPTPAAPTVLPAAYPNAQPPASQPALTVVETSIGAQARPTPPPAPTPPPSVTPPSAPPPSVAPPPAPPRKAAPRARPKVGRGYLTVMALPWAHVEINGARLPKHTPIIRHRIKAGRYKVTLIGPSGRRVNKTVRVRGGQESKLTHQFN